MNIKSIVVMNVMLFCSIKAAYNAELYRKSNVRQSTLATQELAKFTFKGNEKVLDIGSGDGQVSEYIAQEYIPNGSLVGIDNNAEMVAFANKNKRAQHTSYACADAADYVAPEEYDVTVSFMTLHWVPEYGKVIENIYRSLKPGGRALLCHNAEVSPIPPIVEKLLQTPEWSDYQKGAQLLRFPSLLEVIASIKKTEFRLENLEFKKQYTLMKPDTLIKNWLSLPLFNFLPEDVRDKFCQEVIDEYVKDQPLNDQGELSHWSPVVVAVLKK